MRPLIALAYAVWLGVRLTREVGDAIERAALAIAGAWRDG